MWNVVFFGAVLCLVLSGLNFRAFELSSERQSVIES